MKSALRAAGIGIGITLFLLILAFVADALGFPTLSRSLFWQNTLLQNLCLTPNIGTPEHPFYEGTPINFLAFVASVPLGFFVYGLAAYVVLRWKSDEYV